MIISSYVLRIFSIFFSSFIARILLDTAAAVPLTASSAKAVPRESNGDQRHKCRGKKYNEWQTDKNGTAWKTQIRKAYHTAYKKSKNPDAYFRKHELQIILYNGARRMLEQAGIPLKSLNIDKMKTEYQALTTQKNELTATYKNCEKEVKSLNLKLENLNQYLGRTETLKNEQEQSDRNGSPIR